MPSFSTEVPHRLDPNDAKVRLEAFLDEVRKKYEDHISRLEGSWQDNTLGFSLTAVGMIVKGTITVTDNAVRLEVRLPLAAAMFKRKIIGTFQEALEKVLRPE